ncbi:hypothetical protein AAG906_022483 [Vitis piasezkii]
MLRPRVPSDPRSCQMDGRMISTNIDILCCHDDTGWWQGHHHPTGGGGTWVMAGCCDNEKRATCILREIHMIVRATCHHEMWGTCSQEEGSLHRVHQFHVPTNPPGECVYVRISSPL